MDWTRIMNKFRWQKNTGKMLLLEQAVQEFLAEIAVDLNVRMLCETADSTMLWIDSITVTSYEPAPSKGFLWELIKNRLLGIPLRKYNRPQKRQKER